MGGSLHTRWRRRPRFTAGQRRYAAVVGGLAALLAGTVTGPAQADGAGTTACPEPLAAKATCYTGQDANGAYYEIAVPKKWNGSLVMHAHGGPDLGAASDPHRSAEDLARWSVMVEQGYAWAGSSYRRGGYGTRMAAMDTENLRRLFVRDFSTPKKTFVHGQSWGGNVAAKVVEMYGSGSGSGKKKGPYSNAGDLRRLRR